MPGLYFYDNDVVGHAEELKPSARGGAEEITNLNQIYLEQERLQVAVLPARVSVPRHRHLRRPQRRQQLRACDREAPGHQDRGAEEVAWRMGFIDDATLTALAEPLVKSGYGAYLLGLLDNYDDLAPEVEPDERREEVCRGR